jgi:hypothetical protein
MRGRPRGQADLRAAAGEVDRELAEKIRKIFAENMRDRQCPDAAALDQLALRLSYRWSDAGKHYARYRRIFIARWVFDLVNRSVAEAYERSGRHRFCRSAPESGALNPVTVEVLKSIEVHYTPAALEKALQLRGPRYHLRPWRPVPFITPALTQPVLPRYGMALYLPAAANVLN